MRFYTLVVSIVVHVVLLIVLVIIPLAAIGALPGIRVVPAFIQASAAELPDVPPPPGDRRPAQSAPESTSPSVPLHAPDRIAPEGPPAVVVPQFGDGPATVPGGLGAGTLVPVVPIVTPPPPPRTPVRPGGDIQVPKKITHVAPVYPPLAIATQTQGTVILDAVIGEDGRVRDVRILRSIPLLDQAAMDAVRRWRFTPTLLNGQPVPVVMNVQVSFVLSR